MMRGSSCTDSVELGTHLNAVITLGKGNSIRKRRKLTLKVQTPLGLVSGTKSRPQSAGSTGPDQRWCLRKQRFVERATGILFTPENESPGPNGLRS